MKTNRLIRFASLFILLTTALPAFTQSLETLWSHINMNERDKAFELVSPKIKNNSASLDEYLTYYFLRLFNGEDSQVFDFNEQVQKSDNPYPYIYALWFDAPVAGPYGGKFPHQLTLLNDLITASPGHGTLRAAAHYSMHHHYVRAHQFDLSKKEKAKIGAVAAWQFVGPFSNISGSGFNKNYEPIQNPSNDAVFTSSKNAPIKWFTPIHNSNDGWIPTQFFISDNTGSIVFAQTFVNSPVEQDVYLCAGLLGTIKVWVNDQLIISVADDHTTEMDTYNGKCHLNKGFNRILVQNGSENDEPNFIIRLTDDKFEPIPDLKVVPEPQPYTKATGGNTQVTLPHFAETYFLQKIKDQPENLVNYLLLNEVYLRNKKVFEARNIIEKAIALAPENSMLKFGLIRCYLEDGNRAGASELLEYFREHEKESLLSYAFTVSELMDQEKYQEALEAIEKKIKLYGEDEESYDEMIQVLGNLNQVPRLVEVIGEAYNKFPYNDKFASYVFNVEKQLNKNPKKALKILEDHLAKNHNYALSKMLMKEYYSQQMVTKPGKMIQEIIDAFPYDPNLRLDLLNDYLGQQRYQEALEVCNYMLKMKPYSGYYYQNKASVEESLNNEKAAIESYRMALRYQPTLYDSRDKLLTLEKKKNLLEEYSSEKIEDLLPGSGKDIKTEDHDYYYVQYEKVVQMYPEGGREEIHTYAVKILNQRGIDQFNEVSLPYNSNTETLQVEEAQLYKADGTKVKPELNDNQVIWVDLEVGDVLFCKYKIRNYLQGKFANEFYDHYYFEGFSPVELDRYILIAPSSRKINYQMVNDELLPSIKEEDGYKIYTWEKRNMTPVKEEPYMPPSADFASTLHISTINDWNEIATWYSDVVYSKIADDKDYEVAEVYKELFDGKTNLTADQKAKTIYDYIAKNISYSSVSFRQSSIIPQKASKTINTRLGDCKDISTLFVSLANMCGLKSNLVLVSTRDNGTKDMILPSFLFNHCIVKYFDEKNAEHYLELTDRDLPFKSLPPNLYQASSLTIPSQANNIASVKMDPVNTAHKTPDKLVTKVAIKIDGNNMNVVTKNIKYGSLSSSMRTTYRSLSEEKIKQERHDVISQLFTNPVKINKVTFADLYENLDSVSVTTDMTVTNQVKKIGSVSAFPITYTDVIFTAAPFNVDDRKFDFEYWSYENSDEYETVVDVVLPAGKAFVDIPKDETFSFNDITYSISYMKTAPDKLTVVRKAHINRNNIKPADYEAFKAFAMKVIEAEGAYITFN
jgi:tetratricopeptide (TPR) repeat protein